MTSGLLLVDKPTGITSFDVVRAARKALQVKKIGHAGTLDPFASGLMILAIGQATKALSELLLSDKKYTAEVHFGANSTTDDPEGEITENKDGKQFSQGDLEKVLKKFHGHITQTPPVYSALKIGGKRACDLVRKGHDITEQIAAKTRTVEIFDIKLTHFSFPEAVLEVHCSSGTYIRTLARDIGAALSTGAYLKGLRRTAIGNFQIANAVMIEEINIQNILPLQPEYFSFPSIQISEEEEKEIFFGRSITLSLNTLVSLQNKNTSGQVSLFRAEQIIGFGKVSQKDSTYVVEPKKLFLN